MRLDRPRSGSILVLSAFLMLIMLGMVAFVLDTGYIVALLILALRAEKRLRCASRSCMV